MANSPSSSKAEVFAAFILSLLQTAKNIDESLAQSEGQPINLVMHTSCLWHQASLLQSIQETEKLQQLVLQFSSAHGKLKKQLQSFFYLLEEFKLKLKYVQDSI